MIKSNIMHNDPILKYIFPDPPMTVFKKAPSIRDRLVRSYLPGSKSKTWLNKELLGTFRCGIYNRGVILS